MSETLADRYWAVRFESRRRQFYYSGRMTFWAWLDSLAQIAGFMTATAAFVALAQGHDAFGKWSALLVATLSALAICLKAGERARECQRLYSAYVNIECMVPPPDHAEQTAASADMAEAELRRINSCIGWGMPCYDALCYNDACVSFGINPACDFSWIERTIGRWLPIRYTYKVMTNA